MPEVTDLLVPGSEVTSGFWIRRAASPAEAGVTRTQRLLTATDKKENVLPEGYLVPSPWWRQTTRKSPLPEWYPRTPLRDITAIVNALERRRLRVQAEQANIVREATPESTLTNAVPQELNVTDPNPLADSTPNSPVEHPLQIPCGSSTSQFDQAPGDMQQNKFEEKLCRSIDQIEKIVKKNLKTARVVSAKKVAQRRALMSMR